MCTKNKAECDKVLTTRSKLCDSNESQISCQNLAVIRKLSNTKFPVYLALSQDNKQHYAMKIFPYNKDAPHKNFYNEIRFDFLNHPNIIDIVHSEKDRETVQAGKLSRVSYLLMEYAPYGDFFDFITKHREKLNTKLVRTYFKQLIDGIEYLHENGVAHVDLKPENLLIGDDFNLKITDFDLSYISEDPKIISNGTRYYRAPELFRSGSSIVKLPFAADIYSAGVILFILKSGGIYPHAEDDGVDHGSFVDMMYKNNSQFWIKHCEIQGRETLFYDKNFRKLFNGMVRCNPAERLTIRQIKNSRWYNGPVYSPRGLANRMKKILNC